MEVIKNKMGFDCHCCICVGKIPGQEDITKELVELNVALDREISIQEGKEKEDPSDCVKIVDKIVDRSLRLYVGHIQDKTWALLTLARFGHRIRDEGRLGRAKMELKKLAEETQLKFVMKRYRDIFQFPPAWL